MSTLIMAQAWPLRMPPVAKSVLISLADQANDQGYCWPAISTICSRTCYGRSAVIEAITWLESAGAITADRQNGRHTSYWVTPSEANVERAELSTYRSATRTGPPRKPVHVADGTGSRGGRDQSATRTLTVKNRKEPNTPLPPKGGAPGFESFFAGYPRQVDEAGAQKAWDALAPNEQLQGEIAQAVLAWIRSPDWQRENGRFIPKPGNWLRNGRWRDVVGATTPPRASEPSPSQAPRMTDAERAANSENSRRYLGPLMESLGCGVRA